MRPRRGATDGFSFDRTDRLVGWSVGAYWKIGERKKSQSESFDGLETNYLLSIGLLERNCVPFEPLWFSAWPSNSKEPEQTEEWRRPTRDQPR